MSTFRLSIIGLGNMGSAALHGLLEANILRPQEIVVAEHDEERRQHAADLGCAISQDAAQIASADQIMLAVKPQGFAEVGAWIGKLLEPTVVISVMAGVPSQKISDMLGPLAKVVRVMPNTPCRIGRGMTAIALGHGAAQEDAALATEIFDALGHSVQVDEAHIDAATALGGSGPAYVFLLAEAMVRAGIGMGLEEHVALQITDHTIAGAGQLLLESEPDAAALRAMVTSKGGTTAAAIDLMLEHKFDDIVLKAVEAAQKRGQELGRH